MGAIQLIFCVETTPKANTDWIYIKSIIDKYYLITPSIKLNKVYLEGKFNYNNKKIEKKITEYVTNFNGDSHVYLCLDKDKHAVNPVDNDFIREVKTFVTIKSYELIWFVETIELVFLDKRIPDKEKTNEAIKYLRKSSVNSVSISKLEIKNPMRNKTSNLIHVLDKRLTRKS